MDESFLMDGRRGQVCRRYNYYSNLLPGCVISGAGIAFIMMWPRTGSRRATVLWAGRLWKIWYESLWNMEKRAADLLFREGSPLWQGWISTGIWLNLWRNIIKRIFQFPTPSKQMAMDWEKSGQSFLPGINCWWGFLWTGLKLPMIPSVWLPGEKEALPALWKP